MCPTLRPLLLHGADQGPASGDCLQATGVAASAGDSGGGRNLGVPEFACAAEGSALEYAAGDDAGAQAGRGLDQKHVVEAVPLPAPLREHDHVGVVVEQDRGGRSARVDTAATGCRPSRSWSASPGCIRGWCRLSRECSDPRRGLRRVGGRSRPAALRGVWRCRASIRGGRCLSPDRRRPSSGPCRPGCRHPVGCGFTDRGREDNAGVGVEDQPRGGMGRADPARLDHRPSAAPAGIQQEPTVPPMRPPSSSATAAPGTKEQHREHHPPGPGGGHRPHHRTQQRIPRRLPAPDSRRGRPRPARGRLACANLAHGFAASGKTDKKALRGMVKPNIAIVSSYNDMLSAHKPFEAFPAQLKQAVLEAGGIAQFAGGVPAMCDGITQGRDGMQLSLFSRDVIAMSTAIALSHDMFDATLMLGCVRQDRARNAHRRPGFRSPADGVRPGRPDDLRAAQRRESQGPAALRREQGRPRRAARRRGRVVSRQRNLHLLRHRQLQSAADGSDGPAPARVELRQPRHTAAHRAHRRSRPPGHRDSPHWARTTPRSAR